MIRIFNHYLHRRTLMQILFDFGFIIVAVLGAVLTQVHLRSAVPNAVTYGILLALALFVINTASGFYERSPNRSLNQSCARAVLALLLVLPLEYVINGLLPEGVPNRDAIKWAALMGVAAVIAHRVYVTHSGSQALMRTRILVFGSGPAAALVGVGPVAYREGPSPRRRTAPAPPKPRSRDRTGDSGAGPSRSRAVPP